MIKRLIESQLEMSLSAERRSQVEVQELIVIDGSERWGNPRPQRGLLRVLDKRYLSARTISGACRFFRRPCC